MIDPQENDPQNNDTPESGAPQGDSPEGGAPMADAETAADESRLPDEVANDEVANDEAASDDQAASEVISSEDSAAAEVPMGPIEELSGDDEDAELNWFILKVQVNREDSIRSALERRVKVAGLERFFAEIIVPTEDVVEFTKSGKKRLVKRKLFPGYLLIRMAMTDDAWFLVRETPGVGDFTGSAYGSRPSPMDQAEVDRIIHAGVDAETGEAQVKTAIPFKPGDRVRVKEGYFENFEGEVESIDEANGRVTVIISIFGRSTPVELEHWQVEAL